MKEIIRYKCDYCKKVGVKKTIEKHEQICFYNPKNEACGSCLMFENCDMKDKYKGMINNPCQEWLNKEDFQ